MPRRRKRNQDRSRFSLLFVSSCPEQCSYAIESLRNSNFPFRAQSESVSSILNFSSHFNGSLSYWLSLSTELLEREVKSEVNSSGCFVSPVPNHIRIPLNLLEIKHCSSSSMCSWPFDPELQVSVD